MKELLAKDKSFTLYDRSLQGLVTEMFKLKRAISIIPTSGMLLQIQKNMSIQVKLCKNYGQRVQQNTKGIYS